MAHPIDVSRRAAMRAGLRAGLGGALLAAIPARAQPRAAAAAYPERPVRIVVPFAAGAGPDIRARQLADKLAHHWGQPVVVDNRPGAGGLVGMQHAAGAAPDGYTLVMAGQSALAIQPHLVKQPFDALRDFVPVASTGVGVMLLAVNPRVPAASVAELIALARSQPGKLNASSWGNATIPHLALELFKRSAGVDITHVLYKEAAQSIRDLVAGEVQLTFDFVPVLLPQVRAGRLKVLAVTGTQRLALLPDVPTFREAGVREMETVGGWQGVAVPAGTPEPVVAQINAAVLRVLALPEVRASYVESGFDPRANTPAEFAAFIRSEHERWGRLIAAAGIRGE